MPTVPSRALLEGIDSSSRARLALGSIRSLPLAALPGVEMNRSCGFVATAEPLHAGPVGEVCGRRYRQMEGLVSM